MDSINKLLKTVKPSDAMDYATYALSVASMLYIFYCGQIATIGLGIGVACILYSILRDVSISLLAGSFVGLLALHYSRTPMEPFADVPEDAEEEADEEKEVPKPKKKKKVPPPPDHRERAEMFELGKKYKIPSEEDDEDYHLDAGTTFLNAYKSLKPDQVAAMTKDTQELMQTQKQLMSTLQTLKPLIQDGKEMMNMFQNYFGSGQPSLT